VRVQKVIAILVLLLVILIGAVDFYYSTPGGWYSRTRAQSIRVLETARTTNDLQSYEVLQGGAFVPLSNGSWIAIRYVERRSGAIYYCAIARDSAGSWFECDRLFDASLSEFWWELKMRQGMSAEEMRTIGIEPWTNVVTIGRTNSWHIPKLDELIPLALAPDLQSAHRELAKIGFTELQR
jgi:hypothetical protein